VITGSRSLRQGCDKIKADALVGNLAFEAPEKINKILNN
jgi:hypothetical protein